ncbi:MAG: FkbM family methyltransferase [Alphaproteobacteria bacterium]|nr:FkbM family methyltransferase [Alphaproteobacteria bacterium]
MAWGLPALGMPAALPDQTLRDWTNRMVASAKFRWVPFRGYYRFRAHKYMHRIDPEMKLLKFLVDPRRISIDAGANLGIFTYFLARYSAHVHAFEPNPLPFGILRSVADSNVTLYPIALTDCHGEVKLIVPRGRKGWTNNGASLSHRGAAAFRVIAVPGRRIDDLGLCDVGFIKIDVEGHEAAVLGGAVDTLARDRPNLLVENEYAHAGAAAQEVFDLLRDLDDEGFFVADGLLKSLSQFSFEQYRTAPRRNLHRAAAGYVKNFIFVPR